jgi:hypothetical protein
MAKVIKYKFLSCEVNHGTEENPDIEQIFLEKSMGWNETNEEIAKREAYNSEYTIEDDGKPEPVAALSPEDRIAELEAALAMLLSGVTE